MKRTLAFLLTACLCLAPSAGLVSSAPSGTTYTASRAQAAAMLRRFLENAVK